MITVVKASMIVIDCRSVFGYPSGLLGYQRALAHQLPEIAQGEHFVLLRQSEAPGRLSYSPNAHELFIHGDSEKPWAPLLTGWKARLDDIQLFHATAGLFPYGVHAPVVTTVHDLLWLTNPEMIRPPGVRGRLQAALTRTHLVKALRESARILVPSLATKREVERVAPFAAERVVYVPHGVSEQFVPLEQMSERDQMLSKQHVSRLLSGAPRFVMDVGRAAPYRNHEGLVRGFSQAFRGDEDIHLVFVQPLSPYTNKLIRLADKLGMADRLHILSGVSSKHLVALYQHAACVCHPTLHEAYGTVVVEAMACGCPVITSGRAGAGELVEGVGQLINPEHDDEIAAALRRVLFDSGVAARMRARGLARASKLSAERMARQVWEVYRDILQQGS